MDDNEKKYLNQLVIDTIKACEHYTPEATATEVIKCFNGRIANEQTKVFKAIMDVVLNVEARCLAADGPVTPTLQEMTEDEMRKIWLLALNGSKI